MTAHRFILHSLAFTGPNAETARLDFDDKVKFIYGASNTGKSFALAAVDFMLGGSPKDLPDFSQRDPYDTAWLSLSLPGKGPITLSRALAGGSFGLWDGFVTGETGEPRTELDQKHSATKTDSLSHLLLEELGLTDKKIAKNKSGQSESLSFRQLAPFVLIDETAMFATWSPVESGQRDDVRERSVFRLLLTGRDDSAIVAVMKPPEFKTSKTAKVATVDELIANLDKDIAIAAEAIGPTGGQNFDERLQAARTAWEQTQGQFRELLAEKRRATIAWEQTARRRDGIDMQLERYAQLDRVYVSDMARLEALEEAGFLLALGSGKECPLCGAAPESQRIDHGHDEVERQRAAALAEIRKIAALRKDLKTTVGDVERQHRAVLAQLEAGGETVKAIEARIEAAQPRVQDTQVGLEETIKARDADQRYRQLLQQRADLLAKRDEYMKLKQSRKDQPVLKAPNTALHEFCGVMSEVLKAWQFPGNCEVSFDEALYDVKIDGKARRSNGKGVRALTHAAFKIALLLYCRRTGLPHPGFLVLDSPLVAYRDPVTSRQGNLEEGEAVVASSPVREKFFAHLAELSATAQFIVFDNIDPPPRIEELAATELFSGSLAEGRYGLFPVRRN